MFILSAALEKTGVIDHLYNHFEKLSRGNPRRILISMVILVAIPSAFVNNTPMVVIFMPIIIKICLKKDLFPSQYLIPLSYIAIAGGTLTIIGSSSNLMAAVIAQKKGLDAFSLFETAPLGILFLLIITLYLLFIAPKLLPKRITLASTIDNKNNKEFISHLLISENSKLIGQLLSETLLAKKTPISIFGIIRDEKYLETRLSKPQILKGDELLVKGTLEDLQQISREIGHGETDSPATTKDSDSLWTRPESASLMEGIVGA